MNNNTFLLAAKRISLAGAVIVCSLLLANCHKGKPSNTASKEASGPPVQGDWVVIHALSDPESLNLITASDALSQEIFGYLYESLTQTDPFTLQTIPLLADSLPTISADHLSYDVMLKKTAKFSDGQPVTGEDIIFYLKAIKNPYIPNAAPQRGYFTRVDRIELVNNDPYHIKVFMNSPYSLGDQYVGGMYALPKHIWDPTGLSDKYTFDELNKSDPAKNPAIKQMAESFNDNARGFDKKYVVGSGPYMFESFGRNDRVTFARNPNYWNSADKYGKAYPSKIIWRTINDGTAALASLKRGEIDLVPRIEPVQFHNEAPNFPNFNAKAAVYDYPSYIYLGYNERNPIFQDKVTRQALAHAIDRDQIIKKIFFDMAVPVQSPIYRGRPECDTTIPIIKFDLAEAKKLLQQAGWGDSDGDGTLDKTVNGQKVNFTFSILYNSGNKRREQIALIFISALKSLGIQANSTAIEFATMIQRLREGNFDAYIGGWAMPVLEGDEYQIWHSSSAVAGGSNYAWYKNPRIDSIIEAKRNEFDAAKRKELDKQFQQIINEDQPYNFLVTEKYTGGYSDRFQNVQFFAQRPCYNAAWWWVPLDQQKYKGDKPVATR